jgi:hypothetical protein
LYVGSVENFKLLLGHKHGWASYLP